VLFAHVPNEFRLNTISTMLGRRTSVRYHKGFEEWEDPHLRRFTDLGFDKFLARHFEHRLRIVDLRYTSIMRLLSRLGLSMPLFLEYGPTYLCTNDPHRFAELARVKRDLLANRIPLRR
jgi:hypothetical protein